MPQTIRELKALLRHHGFSQLSGKGSHTNWIHPHYPGKLTLSGKDSEDARRYPEKAVYAAIAIVRSNTHE